MLVVVAVAVAAVVGDGRAERRRTTMTAEVDATTAARLVPVAAKTRPLTLWSRFGGQAAGIPSR